MVLLVAMINAVVLILNPEQSASSLLISDSIENYMQTEDVITSSHEGKSFSSVQNTPGQESRYSSGATSLLQLTLPILHIKETRTLVQVTIHKPGSRFLPDSCLPELNEPELFLLHRRLNT